MSYCSITDTVKHLFAVQLNNNNNNNNWGVLIKIHLGQTKKKPFGAACENEFNSSALLDLSQTYVHLKLTNILKSDKSGESQYPLNTWISL
jgi:hypothetical protein